MEEGGFIMFLGIIAFRLRVSELRRISKKVKVKINIFEGMKNVDKM